MAITLTPEWHAAKGYSCVYCWHDRSYHRDGPCTRTENTTDGHIPCGCPRFYERKDAIRLIDQHQPLTPSEPVRYPDTTTAEDAQPRS